MFFRLFILLSHLIVAKPALSDTKILHYPNKEFINWVVSENLEGVTASPDAEQCQFLKSGFSTFVSHLTTSTNSLQAVVKTLVLIQETCAFSKSDQLSPFVYEIAAKNKNLLWNVFQPLQITRLIPKKITTLPITSNLQVSALIKFYENGWIQAAQTDSCVSDRFESANLPPQTCWSHWHSWKLMTENQTNIWKTGENSLVAFAGKWAATFPQVFTVAPSPWLLKAAQTSKHVKKTLLPWMWSQFEGKNFERLEIQSRFVAGVLEQPRETMTRIASCDETLKKTSSLAKSFTNGTPQDFWGLIGRITVQNCIAVNRVESSLKTLELSIPPHVTLTSGLKDFGHIDLGQTQIQIFSKDLDLRRQMGLAFSYGSEFDREDLENQKVVPKTFVVDSVIAAKLRQADEAPWVRLNEDIENVEANQSMVAFAIAGALKDNSSSVVLQDAFLNLYDRVRPGSGSLAIPQIRDTITKIAYQLPKAKNLAFAIHNGLHPGLIDATRLLESQLTAEEKAQFSTDLHLLIGLLEGYFTSTKLPCETLASVADSLLQKTDYKSPAAQLVAQRCKDASELPTLQFYENVQKQIQLELSFTGSKEIKLWLTKLRHYIHQMAISSFGSSNNASKVLRYFSTYLNIRPTQDVVKFISNVQEQVGRDIQLAIAKFRWYLFVQSRRDVVNRDYQASLLNRIYALQFVSESVLRENGLFALASFDLQGNQTFRTLNPGVAVGKVRLVESSNLESHAYRADEILVTNGLPLNLGVTAAVVTALWQPVSSHIDLRTRERGTPNAFQMNAMEFYKEFEGQWIELKLEIGNAPSVKILTEAEALKRIKLPQKLTVQEALLTSVEPVDVDTLTSKPTSELVTQIGAKAAGYVSLRRVFAGHHYAPNGFAIPFGAYERFIQEFGIKARIDAFLINYKKMSSEEIQLELEQIREDFDKAGKQIEFSQPGSWLATKLIPKLEWLKNETIKNGYDEGWNAAAGCFRFRSSTNSEDLLGFTGAGLYDSQGGCLKPELSNPKKTVAKAVARAWASLWNYRAFAEREYFGIEHSKVSMALLVHRNWADEDINGVILSRSKMDGAYIISASSGDSVTNPTAAAKSTEIVASLSGENANILSHAAGDAVFSEHELSELVRASRAMWLDAQNQFKGYTGLPALRMDMEFKFQSLPNGTRRLYIKQARPFVAH